MNLTPHFKQNLEHVIADCVNRVIEFCETALMEKREFTDVVVNTQKEVNALGINVLETFFADVEENFKKNRNKKEIIIRNNNKSRHILTTFGLLTLNHTLYFDKISGKYFFPTDSLLGLNPRCRMDKNLTAKLVEAATHSSYGKAASICGVSRQTAYNAVKRLKNFDAPIKVNSKTQDIYIEADEEHIHLNDGRASEVKLVYVHEGYEGTKRRALINPRYFTTASVSSIDELWNDVADYVSSNYPSIKNVHLSGDGAEWIREGLKAFPKASYHIDKFHVNKALVAISQGNRQVLSHLRKHVYAANDVEYVKIIKGLSTLTSNGKYNLPKNVYDNAMYVYRNMDFLAKDNRCCAEGHISHILSCRLSSRPMGWSRAGAERIAKLRCFLFNKGTFIDLIKSQIQQGPGSQMQECVREKIRYNKWVNACDGEGYRYIKSGSICNKYHHLLDILVNKNTYK